MPLFPGKMVDWVPVDIAASTITEILVPGPYNTDTKDGRQKGRYSVHNIVNPHQIEWRELVTMLQETRHSQLPKLEEISMKAWVERLSALADKGLSPDEVPGLKLLQFFEKMVDDEGQSKFFETGKTREISKSLRDLGPYCKEWLLASFDVWRKDGFLV